MKKQTRKTTVKNENKFKFSKLSDFQENNVFIFNLPTWKSSKYIFLESKREYFTFNLLTQKNDDFYKHLGSSFWSAWYWFFILEKALTSYFTTKICEINGGMKSNQCNILLKFSSCMKQNITLTIVPCPCRPQFLPHLFHIYFSCKIWSDGFL